MDTLGPGVKPFALNPIFEQVCADHGVPVPALGWPVRFPDVPLSAVAPGEGDQVYPLQEWTTAELAALARFLPPWAAAFGYDPASVVLRGSRIE